MLYFSYTRSIRKILTVEAKITGIAIKTLAKKTFCSMSVTKTGRTPIFNPRATGAPTMADKKAFVSSAEIIFFLS